MQRGYDFDDLLLVPRASSINSRDAVDLSVTFDHLKLDIPIIASPMKGIISLELIEKLSDLGGIGIQHRFYTASNNRIIDTKYLSKNTTFGVAVGLNDNYYKTALDLGADIICVDIANGYLSNLIDFVEEISSYINNNNYGSLVMSGNIVTSLGAVNLFNAGVDIIRVGIGSGGLCTTRNYTGVGVPQLTAISNSISKTKLWYSVADGGIRNSGDAVKALAMGADAVMIGSLFGNTYESAHNGIMYGMASRKLQEEYYHGVKSVEGMEKAVSKNISLETLISEFVYGIKSACTYLDASNLKELKANAVFIEAGTGSIKRGF